MKNIANTLTWLLAVVILAGGCEDSADSAVHSEATTVIYRGNGGEPGSLDPALAEDIHAFNILVDLYEGLVAESAGGDLVPGVAKSWAISDDGLVYTFALRENAQWSNGDLVTSDDFVRAFRWVANPATTSVYGSLLEPLLHFSEVQGGSLAPDQLGVLAVGDFRLQIRLREPAPQLMAVLAMPVAFPRHASLTTASSLPDAADFIGNGAYTLASYAPGRSIKLRKSSTYWDATSVAVDEIVYLPIVNPLTEFNMYRAAEIDITHNIPSEQVSTLRMSSPEHVHIAPSLALYYLAFDLTEPPLDDARLRKALNMAIDRETLVALIGRGEQPAYGIVPAGITGHVSSSFSWRDLPIDEREQRARELYRSAGYGVEAPLTIKYIYDNEDVHERIALAVGSMWREVLGLEVTLEKREWQYFLDTRTRRREWQVMRFAWFGDYNHASTFTNIFRSDDSQNLPGYRNADYDRLLSRAAIGKNATTRAELTTQAERLLLEDAPIVPLYFFVSKHLVRPGIRGFEPNPLDRHPSKYLSLEQNH